MASLPDPVRVQLLTDGWQDPGVWALGLSVASIVLTLLFRFWDRVKVDVDVLWPAIYFPGQLSRLVGRPLPQLLVTVTNRSRSTGTTVHAVRLQVRASQNRWQWRKTQRLPMTVPAVFPPVAERLEPGDACHVVADMHDVDNMLTATLGVLQAWQNGRPLVRVLVEHGHGKTASPWTPMERLLPDRDELERVMAEE